MNVVAVNVPATWHHLSLTRNELEARMFEAINDMLLNIGGDCAAGQ